MKYLLILICLLSTGCAMFGGKTNANLKRYNCVKNLVEIKVPAGEAIGFCSKNFQSELGE